MRRGGEDTSAATATSTASDNGREPSEGQGCGKPWLAKAAAVETPPAPGLHLVATPIGNLSDIGLRALAVLRGADRIYCEDTRVTGKLLARYGIDTALEPYHDHNAEAVRPAILSALRQGLCVVLVSDAGTPLISDPGYKLVREAIADGLPVSAVPGPSAVVTALILSGLPPDRFFFAGFLPRQPSARREALSGWAGLDATLVLYEAAPRLAAALADMNEILGPRPAAVARELTKLHEEVRRADLAALAAHYSRAGPPKGEIVVVVGPPLPVPAIAEEELVARLRAAVAELGVSRAAGRLATETGLPRQALYRRALALRKDRE
jgi:16S rRNA (cytidine1402-2'-O)-methyltransferase